MAAKKKNDFFMRRLQNKNKLTEINKKLSVSKSLILRHCHDTRHIVFLLALLFLQKMTKLLFNKP